MNSPSTREEAARLKRQGAEQAIQLALESKWEEAVTLNRSLAQLHPGDVDAWNRLGKALFELGRFGESRDAYSKSLALDPVGTIAKRNLERLATIAEADARRPEAVSKVAQDIFIEEIGKTGVTVIHGLAPERLLGLTAGDEVYLKSSEAVLSIEDAQGEVLGTVDAKLGLRLLRLISSGNRYAAAIKSVGDDDAEVIIKEIYRDPSQTRVSFPTVGGEGVRPYIRESLLRFSGDDEDDEAEIDDDGDDWEEPEAEAAEPNVSLSSLQTTIERDSEDEEEE